MLHSRELDMPTDEFASDQDSPPETTIEMTDRASPRGALVLGGIFTLGSATCLTAVIVVLVLLLDLVAGGGETNMVPPMFGIGAIFIFGMLALDFTHSRALAGFRRLREENRMRVQALLALPVFLVLSVIHPLAGLGLPLGIGTGALALWGLSRLGTVENPWGFVPAEAMSILAGRDTAGLDLASATESNHALAAPVRQGGSWLAVLGAVASGSYLVASDVLVPGAVLALALWSYWITDRTLAYLTVSALRHQHNQPPSAVVRRLETEIMEDPRDGLVVQDLTVRSTGGTPYLNAVSMQVDPGEVVGIIGESGTGKSLFLRALADPFSLAGLEISGAVHWDQQDFWERRATRQRLQAVYLPDQPLLLPTSGANNLACFQGNQLLDRGKWMLEQMVFAHDMVEQICAAPDARLLPSMQRQALALTRAFLLSPNIYLLDQPERALGDSQIAALSRRIDRETRLGRSVVLVSDNRTLLEKCDRLYVLQDGRFVDYGPADEIRTRMAGGWARFIGKRRLSSEDTLEPWIRSHFRRDGDEGNRRKVCIVASELLALSCRNADPNSTETVQFLFKHFQGHCLLQMIDGDPPLSSGQMQIAADLAKAKTLEARKNILASIMTHCQEFDAEGHLDGRILRAKIATYDPRKVKTSAGGDHGPQTR